MHLSHMGRRCLECRLLMCCLRRWPRRPRFRGRLAACLCRRGHLHRIQRCQVFWTCSAGCRLRVARSGGIAGFSSSGSACHFRWIRLAGLTSGGTCKCTSRWGESRWLAELCATSAVVQHHRRRRLPRLGRSRVRSSSERVDGRSNPWSKAVRCECHSSRFSDPASDGPWSTARLA